MTSSFCFDILLNFRTTYIDEVCGVPCRVGFFLRVRFGQGSGWGKNMETKKNQRHNSELLAHMGPGA